MEQFSNKILHFIFFWYSQPIVMNIYKSPASIIKEVAVSLAFFFKANVGWSLHLSFFLYTWRHFSSPFCSQLTWIQWTHTLIIGISGFGLKFTWVAIFISALFMSVQTPLSWFLAFYLFVSENHCFPLYSNLNFFFFLKQRLVNELHLPVLGKIFVSELQTP